MFRFNFLAGALFEGTRVSSTLNSQIREYRSPAALPPLTLAFGLGMARPAITRSRESSVGRFCVRYALAFCACFFLVFFLYTILYKVYNSLEKTIV